jgi:hypothetical protein
MSSYGRLVSFPTVVLLLWSWCAALPTRWVHPTLPLSLCCSFTQLSDFPSRVTMIASWCRQDSKKSIKNAETQASGASMGIYHVNGAPVGLLVCAKWGYIMSFYKYFYWNFRPCSMRTSLVDEAILFWNDDYSSLQERPNCSRICLLL